MPMTPQAIEPECRQRHGHDDLECRKRKHETHDCGGHEYEADSGGVSERNRWQRLPHRSCATVLHAQRHGK
jgi:hypothetical protein